MGKIISIFNQKGGVGKTTTTINLSAALSQKGKSVLIVDMDAQGNSTLGVGIDKRELNKTIYNLLTSKKVTMENILEVLKETSYPNLFILPSNKELGDAEMELASAMSRELILKRILDKLKDTFDYIIIDCPPSFGLLSLNSLSASDGVIIPISAEYFAVEGVADLLTNYDLVKQSVNPDVEIYGVLLTMFDVRYKMSNNIKSALREAFGDKVFNTVIRTDVDIKNSQDNQTPVIYYQSKKRDDDRHAYYDYISLGEELLNGRK